MNSKEEKLAILRLFLRDFNKQIKTYGAGPRAWVVCAPDLLMTGKFNGVCRVYDMLYNYSLKEIDGAKTEIKKEFDKYPHIKEV